MADFEIFLLGAPRIVIKNQPAELDTRKAVALLAYLAVTGQRHTRDTLVALLWPEYDQQRGRAALRRTLSALKTAVGGYGLTIEREALSIDWSSDVWLDVGQFRKKVNETRTHGHPMDEICSQCLHPLIEAVDLFLGDLMSGFSLRDSPPFDDWVYLQGESLRRELSSALHGVMRCHQNEGRFKEAIDYGVRLLDLDPLHEPAHRQLMTLLALDGQRTAALQQYRECIRILEVELGVPPLAETTAVYERILSGQFPEAERAAGLELRQPAAQAASPAAISTSPLEELIAPGSLPLVGRSRQWESLLEWYSAIDTAGRFMVIEGEAGIGKTRLADTFLDQVHKAGVVTLSAQCYEGEGGLAYAPIVEALYSVIRSNEMQQWAGRLSNHQLKDVGRLIPELIPQPQESIQPLPLENAGEQQRFFEAMGSLLMAVCGPSSPGVIFIDDVQWADDASLDLLNYLVRRLRNWPLFVLMSWRPEELAAGHRLRNMFTQSQRQGLGKRLILERLNEKSVGELLAAAAIPSSMVHRLFEESEGLPFFLIEYLAIIQNSGRDPKLNNLQPERVMIGSSPALPMPDSVRNLLLSRFTSVDEVAQQLLHTAAVIGRSFTFDILLEVSGRNEEEIVSALEVLLAHGLLVELRSGFEIIRPPTHPESLSQVYPTSSPVYDYNHEKLRNIVYEEMSLARRRVLHRRVAQAFAQARHRSQTGGIIPAQAAFHFQQAGMEAEAADFFKRAGDQARSLFANAEALAHYQSSLALGHGEPAILHEAVGDLFTLRGAYNRALSNYEAAAATVDADDASCQMAQLEMKLGRVYHRRGDWDLAAGHFEQAHGRMKDDGERARLMTDWSLTAHQMGRGQLAMDLAQEAVVLAEVAEDQRGLAQAYNVLGILANNQGDWRSANQHLEQSLTLAKLLNDPVVKIAALNNLSIARRQAGEVDQAKELVLRALALCVEIGDRHREAALHNNLADLYHLTEDSEEAMTHLKLAVSIYAEIGGEVGQWQPEIWKLTEW